MASTAARTVGNIRIPRSCSRSPRSVPTGPAGHPPSTTSTPRRRPVSPAWARASGPPRSNRDNPDTSTITESSRRRPARTNASCESSTRSSRAPLPSASTPLTRITRIPGTGVSIVNRGGATASAPDMSRSRVPGVEKPSGQPGGRVGEPTGPPHDDEHCGRVRGAATGGRAGPQPDRTAGIPPRTRPKLRTPILSLSGATPFDTVGHVSLTDLRLWHRSGGRTVHLLGEFGVGLDSRHHTARPPSRDRHAPELLILAPGRAPGPLPGRRA